MKAASRAALMIAAVVFLLPLSARCETREGTTEIGLFGGYHFFQSNHNLKDRPVFGGRVGYNFSKHFALEGVAEIVKSRVDDATLTDGIEGEFRSPTDKVRVNYYHIDAIYNLLPESKFDPFIAAGYGLARYSPSISTKAMSAFNFGVGAKYWMSEDVALRFDLRDNMVSEVFQEAFHNVEATIGITFALGGKEKPAPVQPVKVAPKPAPAPQVVVKPEPAPPVVVAPPVIIYVTEPEVEKVIAIVAAPKVEEKVIIIAFEDINFDFDSSALTPEAQTILKRNIQVLKDNPKANVRLAGYTSAAGTEEYNQKLSERRAQAVSDYLVKEGLISADRLNTIGYGEKNPEMYEANPANLHTEAAMANKRVLFVIVLK
jgi:OOP family OmpA-OmpF porin